MGGGSTATPKHRPKTCLTKSCRSCSRASSKLRTFGILLLDSSWIAQRVYRVRVRSCGICLRVMVGGVNGHACGVVVTRAVLCSVVRYSKQYKGGLFWRRKPQSRRTYNRTSELTRLLFPPTAPHNVIALSLYCDCCCRWVLHILLLRILLLLLLRRLLLLLLTVTLTGRRTISSRTSMRL